MLPGAACRGALTVAGRPEGTHMAPLRELGTACGSCIAALLGGECFPCFMSQQLSYKATRWWILGWASLGMHPGACLAPSSWRELNGAHSGSHYLAGPLPEWVKPPRPVVLTQGVPSLHGSGQAVVSCHRTAGQFQRRTGSIHGGEGQTKKGHGGKLQDLGTGRDL